MHRTVPPEEREDTKEIPLTGWKHRLTSPSPSTSPPPPPPPRTDSNFTHLPFPPIRSCLRCLPFSATFRRCKTSQNPLGDVVSPLCCCRVSPLNFLQKSTGLPNNGFLGTKKKTNKLSCLLAKTKKAKQATELLVGRLRTNPPLSLHRTSLFHPPKKNEKKKREKQTNKQATFFLNFKMIFSKNNRIFI